MRNPTPESAIQRTIIETLIWDGWLVLRINCGGAQFGDDDGRYVPFVRWQAIGFAEASDGVPDVIAFKGNKALLIECKAPGGRVRASQKVFSAAVESVGANWIVADSAEALRPYLERVEL